MIKKITTEDFINRAKEIHGEKFDYSLVDYINNRTKIKIICSIHGEFEQTPSVHLRPAGCKLCANIFIGNKGKTSQKDFIEKSLSIHKNKYDYSLVEYINAKTYIKIKCNDCDSLFTQTPDKHLQGKGGCKKCQYIDLANKSKLTKEEYIKKANIVHENKYNYDDIEYINAKTFLNIYCNKCKVYFRQTPDTHLRCGHSNCAFVKKHSKEEKDLCFWISEQNISFLESDKTVLPPKELDIFIPNNNLAIEYNGLHWHSEIYKEKNYHLDKTLKCKEKGIQLFHIFSDEWNNKQEIVKSMIKYRLNLTENKIYSRKLEFIKLTEDESKEFFNENHISGNTKSLIAYGLKDKNNILYSVISFRKPIQKKYDNQTIEIARFANKLNYVVPGSFQKLLAHSILELKLLNYNKILTYADLRFGTGSVYLKSGFDFIGTSKVDYWYTNGKIRENRFKYRAQNGMSEKEYAKSQNMYKIYGCGSNIYLKNI